MESLSSSKQRSTLPSAPPSAPPLSSHATRSKTCVSLAFAVFSVSNFAFLFLRRGVLCRRPNLHVVSLSCISISDWPPHRQLRKKYYNSNRQSYFTVSGAVGRARFMSATNTASRFARSCSTPLCPRRKETWTRLRLDSSLDRARLKSTWRRATVKAARRRRLEKAVLPNRLRRIRSRIEEVKQR